MSDMTGKAKGGKARAESLTPEQRKEIAGKAGRARWDVPIPVVTHSGILKIGDVEFPCYVLDNGQRVLSGAGFMKGLGMYRSGALSTRRTPDEDGAQIPLYLAYKNLKSFVSNELFKELGGALEYRLTENGRIESGIGAITIPKICEVWLNARDAGILKGTQLQIALKCDIIIRSLAQVGIIALVDEATGYQGIRPKDALQEYLDRIIAKELSAWVQRFPEEFFHNIYKLKGWVWPGMKKNRYSIVGHYIKDIVYERLAPGLIKELEGLNPKNDGGSRKNKHHQWLTNDIGHPMLTQHIQTLLTLQRLAISQGYGWNKFLRMVDAVAPKKGSQFLLPIGL